MLGKLMVIFGVALLLIGTVLWLVESLGLPWTSQHRFRFLGLLLRADLDPCRCIDCQNHVVVRDIEYGHQNLTIDHDAFVLGLDENLQGCRPPVYGMVGKESETEK